MGSPGASLTAPGFEDARLDFIVQGKWIAIIFHPQCMVFAPDEPDTRQQLS